MNWHVLAAIFKRNFIAYFSSPTGYVFICVFVALCSLAAFWPNEFFNANLANLDQLNKYLPLIMLAFIPAVTMSIWADERRQGTDELLLTIPAGDMDVVLGKYLAALAIFSVSLGFSMFSNYVVLELLTADSRPDMGLFVGTYIGYWMVGMAMLSVGMVASFLTSNLTVGFILGAIFNTPLVFSQYAEAIIPQSDLALAVKHWSLAEQLSDFQRGVISLSSIVYFVMITVVMLYLANVLIGRRHWAGGRRGVSLGWHYFARTVALLVLTVGLSLLFSTHDFVRQDITSEQLSSLSPDTKRLIRNLETESPVVVEAYVSPSVPPEYVETRLNLLSVLDELGSLGGEKVQVHKHILERFSEEAKLAEEKYDIKPRRVISRSRGAVKEEEIYMAVAFRSGLEKEVLPFIDRGLPPEYELVRSICVVAQEDRPKVGVLKTDATLFSRFDMQSFQNIPDQAIIEELRKQYDVEEVDPSEPIDVWIPEDSSKPDGPQRLKYQALLAVQPSSLTQPQLDNFIAAIKAGQPTAVFEDPMPVGRWGGVPPTSEPRRPQRNPMMPFQQPPPVEPKGQISELWDLLGVDMVGDEIVCQDHNPHPKVSFEKEFVFIDHDAGAQKPFSDESPISKGLQQVLFLYPGAFIVPEEGKLEITRLAQTGDRSGTVSFRAVSQALRSGSGNLDDSRDWRFEPFTIAVHVEGSLSSTEAGKVGRLDADRAAELADRRLRRISDELCQAGEGNDAEAASTASAAESGKATEEAEQQDGEDSASEGGRGKLNVVLVADIDFLISEIFQLRAQGTTEEDLIQWNLDNVPFALNVIDYLADDQRFLDIRTRRRPHRTLSAIDERTEAARKEATKRRKKFEREFQDAISEAEREFNEKLAAIDKRDDLTPTQKRQAREALRFEGQRALQIKRARLEQERDREIERIQRDLELEIRTVQDGYKLNALLWPPVLPLVLAFFVYFHRRHQEREGVSKERLR